MMGLVYALSRPQCSGLLHSTHPYHTEPSQQLVIGVLRDWLTDRNQ